jgi:ATP-dependent DNA helicase RecQ
LSQSILIEADNRDKREQAKKNTQSKRKAPTSSGLEPPAKRQNHTTATGGNEGAVGAVGITDAQTNISRDQLHETLDVQRVSTYSRRDIKNGQKVKHTGDELGPAEDDFVNAATRYFNCYRHPIMLYFGNKQLTSSNSVHGECFYDSISQPRSFTLISPTQ